MAEAWIRLTAVTLRLRLASSTCLPEAGVAALPRDSGNAEVAARAILDVRNALARAARYVPAATCLAEALAARQLLARRQVHTTLRLGVRRERRGRLAAHAWLELDGVVVFGEPDRPYVPLVPTRPPQPDPAATGPSR